MSPPSTRASPARGQADQRAPSPPDVTEKEPPASAPATEKEQASDHRRRRANAPALFFLAAALAALAAWAVGRGGSRVSITTRPPPPPRPHPPLTRTIGNATFPRSGPVSPEEAAALATEAASMFGSAFDAYLAHAWPRDELRPMSCRGRDSQGGVGLTLIDALSTAVTMGDVPRLAAGLAAAAAPVVDPATGLPRPALHFDVDARVHVFELTIRALGGLLSVHGALTRPGSPAAAALPPNSPDPAFLLAAAVDLGDRLLPAYDTPTGLPLSWVNLRHGPVRGDIRATCTACAGTAFLEMAALSAASGDGRYGAAGRRASLALAARADAVTGLVGNTLSVDTGAWIRTDAGVGAGIDSYVEMLLKSFLYTGDAAWLRAWTAAYGAKMRWCNAPPPPPPPRQQLEMAGGRSTPTPTTPPPPPPRPAAWRVDVDMHTGALAKPWVSSLAAFFPGLQVLAGQVAPAAAAHADWASAWARFRGLPEALDALTGTIRHPTLAGYPLRPELAESTFALAAATAHPVYFQVGRMVQADVMERCAAPCGFASLADVAAPGGSSREDTMESFALAETFKYLHLLWSVRAGGGGGAGGLLDAVVLSTEGHPFYPLPGEGDAAPTTTTTTTADWSGTLLDNEAAAAAWPPALVNATAGRAAMRAACVDLCQHATTPAAAAGDLASALPLLGATAADIATLRSRRCRACLATEAAMVGVRAQVAVDAAAAAAAAAAAQPLRSHPGGGASPTPPSIRPRRQAVCLLEADPAAAALTCAGLSPFLPAALASPADLPPNAVILQLSEVVVVAGKEEEGDDDSPGPWRYSLSLRLASTPPLRLAGLAAAFGPALREVEECEGGGGDDESDRPEGCSISAPLVLGSPPQGCTPLAPLPEPAIIALTRGGCSFEAKASSATAAGAVALVVLNTADEHVTMGSEDGGGGGGGGGGGQGGASPPSSSSPSTIPALALPSSQGDKLRAAVEAAAGAGVPLTATLAALPSTGDEGIAGFEPGVVPTEADAAAGGGDGDGDGDGVGGSAPPPPPPSSLNPSIPHRLDVLMPPAAHAWLREAAAAAQDAWEPQAALGALVKRLAGSRALAAAFEGAAEVGGGGRA